MTTDIAHILNATNAEPDEITQVLLDYFGQAAQHDDQWTTYEHRDEEKSALRVLFDKQGRVSAAHTDEGFRETDQSDLIARIHNDLIAPSAERVARMPLFTNVVMEGCYRFQDVFQIIPVPPEAPHFPVKGVPCPFYLEARYRSSPNFSVDTSRQEKALRETELLLSALISRQISSTPSGGHFHWVTPLTGQPPFISTVARDGYSWPGNENSSDAYTETAHLPPLARLTPDAYYTRFGYSVDDRLDLPSNIDDLLHIYFHMDTKRQRTFLRASYWFRFAVEAWRLSRSATHVAFVNAIEAMALRDESRKQCEKCGQMTGKGPTARFAEFLEKYLPENAVPEKVRKHYYHLRSDLVHGKKLLESDERYGFAIFPRTADASELGDLSRIVQIALYNWLVSQAET